MRRGAGGTKDVFVRELLAADGAGCIGGRRGSGAARTYNRSRFGRAGHQMARTRPADTKICRGVQTREEGAALGKAMRGVGGGSRGS